MYTDYISVQAGIINLISSQKKISANRILPDKPFSQLGLDELDLVNLILEAEKNYNVIIPDELPLNNVEDFVNYIYTRSISNKTGL